MGGLNRLSQLRGLQSNAVRSRNFNDYFQNKAFSEIGNRTRSVLESWLFLEAHRGRVEHGRKGTFLAAACIEPHGPERTCIDHSTPLLASTELKERGDLVCGFPAQALPSHTNRTLSWLIV